jgi:tetratricopeptide (TPR) repeat protein
MARPQFILALLLVMVFCLNMYLQPRVASRVGTSVQSGDALALVLGDTRRMLANQLFAKADAYYHSGVYPSIFDTEPSDEEYHIAEEAAHGDHEDHAMHEEAPAPTRDWIERFGRRFSPFGHTHLSGGHECEILPWLRFSAELDPHNIETYTVTAYWLRRGLGKADEAEQFLRQGLRNNPNNPALLSELGHLYYVNRKDPIRAGNLWEAARRQWHKLEGPKNNPDYLTLERILGGLVLVQQQLGQHDKAVGYLEELKAVSPRPEEIQKRIDELKAQLPRAPKR